MVGAYIDDIELVMDDPAKFLIQLQSEPSNFKLKGSGPMNFQFGMWFWLWFTWAIVMNPVKYVDKMMEIYQQSYKCSPETYQLPLVKNNHPVLGISKFLDEYGIHQYQSLIEALQLWIVPIGRFDI